MSKIHYRSLLEEYSARGLAVAERNLREAFREGQLKPEEFDLGELLIECVGWPAFVACRNGGSVHRALLEAGTAVAAAQFANITGQLVFAKIKDAFDSEEFVFSRAIDSIPTRSPNGERIPGVGPIGDKAEAVGEGNPFPLAGLHEDYIDTPPPVKRGMIVPITREAILFDRTNLVLRESARVGEWLGLNKEKRVIDCLIDENATAHRYKWRGSTIATYGDNSGTHSWDNLQATNPLVDWTSVNSAEQLFNGIVDPNTGEPVMIRADVLICAKALEYAALRVRNATEITVVSPGYATSGSPTETRLANPMGGKFDVLSSRLLGARMSNVNNWYYGSPRKAFAYMEVFPLEAQQAPANSEAEFAQDIVQRFRAVEMGAMATLEPRYMVKCTP